MTRRETLLRLAREARAFYPRIVAGLLLGTFAGILPAVPPWAFGQIVNKVLIPAGHGAADIGVLYTALAVTFAALTLGNLATYFQTYLLAWSGQRLIARWRVGLFSRVLNLPLTTFDKWRPGELIARFSSDLQVMTDAVTTSLPQFIQAIVTFITSFGLMVYIDWLMTATLIVVAPIVSIAVSGFQKLIHTSMQRTQGRVSELTANLTEILQGQRVVKAFGRERYEVERFSHRNEDYFGASMKLTQFVQTQPLVVSTLMLFAVTVIIWLSVREVLVGRMNTGLVFAYWTLLINLINPLNRLAAFVGELSKAVVSSGRVFEVLDLTEERRDQGDQPMSHIAGKIVFENVSFWYQRDEPPALSAINASIDAGEIVALVGPSGAGKTTIVNLVPRFYEPQEGRVLIDGIDIASVRLDDLREKIAIVPQDPQLFRTSILENIRYGRLSASDDEVRAAAREANADEFVCEFPDGYATEVGERGVRLSGGQRQRIAIARAILRDPRVLILDEATSALDTHSETLIEQALDRLLPGRTTLIIAHRLSTIRRANKILYIEAGRVLEIGTHDELLARKGRYARLHAAQFAG